MEISTKYFDRITVNQDDVIFFEQGMFGFETYREFALINFESDNDNMMCLQSMEDSNLAFVLMNPFNIEADYDPSLSDGDIANLDIDQATKGVLYYAVCVIKDELAESTVNLKCPIVINPQNRKALQLMLDDEKYNFRHSLFKRSEVGA